MLQFEELKLELTGMEPELLDLAEALDLTTADFRTRPESS